MIIEDKLGPNGDALYNALMQAHEGLQTDQSQALNARLVLILMNEIADPDRVKTLLNEARTFST